MSGRLLASLIVAVAFAASAPAGAAAQAGMPDFALPSWSDVLWLDPSNYGTIQTADLDGDGDAELFGRATTQIEVEDFDQPSGNWIPLPALRGFSDAGGWDDVSYWSTIQAGNLDGQGGDEIFARAADGIIAFTYANGAWTQLPELYDASDGAGWQHPEYYSTIQAADLDGDGQDEIIARSAGGLVGWRFDAAGQQWHDLPAPGMFSDGAGWSAPQYYSTIHAADLDGDGADEVYARAISGITVLKFDAAAQQWGALAGFGALSDDNGWTAPQYYTTIQTGDIDGRPGEEILARGRDGLLAFKYSGGGWITLPQLSGPSDAAGWARPEYYSTIQAADVDGDGADDILARSGGGMQGWKFTGGGWTGLPGAITALSDDAGWWRSYYYPSIQTAKTGLNNAEQVLGRGLTGVVTYAYDPSAGSWTTASTPFPAFTTGDLAAAYQYINESIGGRFNTSFDVRASYATTDADTLDGWSTKLSDLPPPPNVSGEAWNAVAPEIMLELDNAATVANWYDTYIAGITEELYLSKAMDDTAAVLNYATGSEAQLSQQDWSVLEGMLEALNVTDLLPGPASTAAVVVNSLLGGGVAAGLGVDGVNAAATSEVQGRYFGIQQQLQSDFNSALQGNNDAQAEIQGDNGLLMAVAGLIGSGAWTKLAGNDRDVALAGAERSYSVSVWQTITPAIWDAYQIPAAGYNDWCVNGGCDWSSPDGNYWELAWNYSAGANCASFQPTLAPCAPAPAGLRQQLFSPTSNSCRTAWSASCNLGQAYADVFYGSGEWKDLPAYVCDETGWAGTLNCRLTRGSDPGSAVARLNLGGAALNAGRVRWFRCGDEAHCHGVARGGSPQQAAGSPTIQGVRGPARQPLYRSGWTARAGRPGTTAFRFEIPARNGTYRLRLHFAETRRTANGRHRFDVNAEGGPRELAGFDIHAEARGRRRAIVRQFPITVADGSATIRFVRRTGRPLVSAIELLPLQGAAPKPPVAGRLRLRVKRAGRRKVALSGRLRAAVPAQSRMLAVELKKHGARRFVTVKIARTRANGTYAVKLARRARRSRVRVLFAGDRAVRPAASRTRRVPALRSAR